MRLGMALDDFPLLATPEREQMILDRVRQGAHEVYWGTITSDHDGHRAEFQVFADALKIDGVRVNVTAETEQLIADELGCMLLTPKLADLIWLQRDITLAPHPRPISSTTKAMIEHSDKIEEDLAKLSNPYGIVCTVGKHWVIDNVLLQQPNRAMNYGWHFVGPNFQGIGGEVLATALKDDKGQFMRLIQGRGTRHDMKHVDYSQTCVLVARNCIVDGNAMDLIDVLSDPALAPLASHQGVLKVFRQPGVPLAA